MTNKVYCGECVYNLTANPEKVACSVMVMEEPVVFDYTKDSGCESGYRQEDAFPEEDSFDF